LSRLCNKAGCREHEGAAQQGDGDDRDNERARRPHCASEDQTREVGEPGAPIMPASTLGDRGDDDALVEVRCGPRSRQRRQQADDPRDATQFSRTCGTRAKVARKASSVGITQLAEQVGVDEWACILAVEDRFVR
jgi:hypothetical protein